jgi:hypothetical protein
MSSSYYDIDSSSHSELHVDIQFYACDLEFKSFKSLLNSKGKLNKYGELDNYQFAFLENDRIALIDSRLSNENQCTLQLWKIDECGAEKLDVKERTSVHGVKALPGCKFVLVSPRQVEIRSENLELINKFEIDHVKAGKFSIESISNELLMFYFNNDELIIYNFQKGEVVKRLQTLASQFFVTWDSQFLVAFADGLLTFYDMVDFNVYNEAESRFEMKHTMTKSSELTFLREKEYFIFDFEDNNTDVFKFVNNYN